MSMNKSLAVLATLLISTSALAKLPPLSDEAKLKALETKQKTAHGDKVSAYQLCKSQDAVAEKYRKGKSKKDAPAPATTPKCEDPGPFVFVPPEAAPASPPTAAPAAATASPPAAAPAAPVAAKK